MNSLLLISPDHWRTSISTFEKATALSDVFDGLVDRDVVLIHLLHLDDHVTIKIFLHDGTLLWLDTKNTSCFHQVQLLIYDLFRKKTNDNNKKHIFFSHGPLKYHCSTDFHYNFVDHHRSMEECDDDCSKLNPTWIELHTAAYGTEQFWFTLDAIKGINSVVAANMVDISFANHLKFVYRFNNFHHNGGESDTNGMSLKAIRLLQKTWITHGPLEMAVVKIESAIDSLVKSTTETKKENKNRLDRLEDQLLLLVHKLDASESNTNDKMFDRLTRLEEQLAKMSTALSKE